MGILTERIKQAEKDSSEFSDKAAGLGQIDEREKAIIDRHKSELPGGSLMQKISTGLADMEIEDRRQKRAYAEKPPTALAQMTVDPAREMVANLGDRARVLDVYRKLSPEQRQEALKLVPGIAQMGGDDRGGFTGRVGSAVARGIAAVSQPIAELVGAGGSAEEIDFIRKLEGAAAQEFNPARPGDPWYERGPLQAMEMIPWMATTVGGAGLGRAAATGIAGRLATSAAAGSKAASVAQKAGQVVSSLPTRIPVIGKYLPAVTAGKVGELAGITAAAFPSQYAQEVDQLKALGMVDDTRLRLLAGGTAAVTGLVEGLVPNPFGGNVALKEGAIKAARQYLWESAKKAPGELTEEYLQGVVSGLGEHVAQHIGSKVDIKFNDDGPPVKSNPAQKKSIADAFSKGWKQAQEAALPMAFLLGGSAVGGASLTAARAQRLQQTLSKGFVSEDDAKQLGIQGNNRKEREANAKAELEKLEALAASPPPPVQPASAEPVVEQPIVDTQTEKAAAPPSVAPEVQSATPPLLPMKQQPTGDTVSPVEEPAEQAKKDMPISQEGKKHQSAISFLEENFPNDPKIDAASQKYGAEVVAEKLGWKRRVLTPEEQRKQSVSRILYEARKTESEYESSEFDIPPLTIEDIDLEVERLEIKLQRGKKIDKNDIRTLRQRVGLAVGVYANEAIENDTEAFIGELRKQVDSIKAREALQVDSKEAKQATPATPTGDIVLPTPASEIATPKTPEIKWNRDDRVFIQGHTTGSGAKIPNSVGKVQKANADNVVVQIDGETSLRAVSKDKLQLPDAKFEVGEKVGIPWAAEKTGTISSLQPDGTYKVAVAGRQMSQTADQMVKLKDKSAAASPVEKVPPLESVNRDVDVVKTAMASEPIGIGGNSRVYGIDDTRVVRVPKNVKEVTGDFTPVEHPLAKQGLRVGQAIAKNEQGVEILQRQAGSEAGLTRPSGNKIKDDAAYAKATQDAASLPQEAYDEFANTLKALDEAGYQFDPSKSSNVLIDTKAGKFNLVDINESKSKKPQASLEYMLVPLIGNTYAYKYKGASLEAARKDIVKKATEAARKAGINLELGSSGKWSLELAGESTETAKTPKAKAGDIVSPESKRDQEKQDAPKTKKGGDPNEVEAKDGRQKQANADAETKAEAERQVGSEEGQTTGETPSPDSSVFADEMDAMIDDIMSKMEDAPKPEAKKPSKYQSPKKSEKTKATAEEKRAQARQAMRDAFKESQGKPTTGLDPEVAMNVAKAAKLYIEAGVLDFKSFVESLTEDFSEAWVQGKAGYLESAWRVANKRGWVSSPAGEVAKLLPAVESKTPIQKQVAKQPDKLKQNGLKVERIGSRWVVSGKTFNNKQILKDAGGQYDANEKNWWFKSDPTDAIATRLPDRGDEQQSSDGRDSDADVERKRVRLRESERPDERGTSDSAVESVSDDTKQLIQRGEKFGIPKKVLEGQVEDIGRVTQAFEAGKPMFLVGSAPGMGKSYILGGSIAEIRKRILAKGDKPKFIYVTENQELISQLKRDLVDYGVDDVEFVTYAGVRGKRPNANGAVVLVDEAHNAKNLETKNGEAIQSMVSESDFTVYATATPFENVAEAKYLEASGVFDGVEAVVKRKDDGGKPYDATIVGFDAWAFAYGAELYWPKNAPRPVIYWHKHTTAEEGQIQANDWMAARGVYTQRPMVLPPEMVKSDLRAVTVDDKYSQMFEDVLGAYAEAEANAENAMEAGMIRAHGINLQKRILEASKVNEGIARAKNLIADGKQVIIFVNTKADRAIGRYRLSEPYRKHHKIKGEAAEKLYTPKQIADMMDEYQRAKRASKQMGGDAGPAPFAKPVATIAEAMGNRSIDLSLPSVTDELLAAFPDGKSVEYTGRLTDTKAKENLGQWKSDKAKVIIATMDKGGTGLSYHDTTGKMPERVQVNINLPWSGTQVEQVSGRLARLGTAKPVGIEWIFADNIPFERELSKTVGSRMRSMQAAVQGSLGDIAQSIKDFEFGDAPAAPVKDRVQQIQDTFPVTREQAIAADILMDAMALPGEIEIAPTGPPPSGRTVIAQQSEIPLAIARNLTPNELDGLRSDVVKDIVKYFESLPPDVEFEEASKAGVAKLGWYKRAAESLSQIFGPDAERFISLLAATSPRQGVTENLKMTLAIWKAWNEAGRPTTKKQITKLMQPIPGAMFGSRRPNIIRSLQGQRRLSGYKVSAFAKNLIGNFEEVTNDAWMATFAGIDQKIFGTKSGYLAFTAKIRKVAKKLGLSPAEVQETIWSFTKTLSALRTGGRTSKEALAGMTHEAVASMPEFAELIIGNKNVRKAFKELGLEGVVSRIASEQAAIATEVGGAITSNRPRVLGRVAKRIPAGAGGRGAPEAVARSGVGDTLYQDQRGLKGTVMAWTHFVNASKAIIGATDKADVSSFFHELGHPMRKFLFNRNVSQEERGNITDDDIRKIEDFVGVEYDQDGKPKWDTPAEERFVDALMSYWVEGKAPTKQLETIFEKISKWLSGVLSVIQRKVELTDDVRAIFDKVHQRGGVDPKKMQALREASSESRAVEQEAPKAASGEVRDVLDDLFGDVAPSEVRVEAMEKLETAGIKIKQTKAGNWSVTGLPDNLSQEMQDGIREEGGKRTKNGYVFKDNPTNRLSGTAEAIIRENQLAAEAKERGFVQTRIGEVKPEVAERYESERAQRIEVRKASRDSEKDILSQAMSNFVPSQDRGMFAIKVKRAAETGDYDSIRGFDKMAEKANLSEQDLFELLQKKFPSDKEIEAEVDDELAAELQDVSMESAGDLFEEEGDASFDFGFNVEPEQLRQTAIEGLEDDVSRKESSELFDAKQDKYKQKLKADIPKMKQQMFLTDIYGNADQGTLFDTDGIAQEDDDLLFQASESPVRQAGRVLKSAIDSGATTFEDFIAHARTQLRDDQIRQNASNLETLWSELRSRGGPFAKLGPVGNTVDFLEDAKPKQKPEPAKPKKSAKPEPAPDEEETTGTKNAKTDELRAKLGFEKRVAPYPETFQEWEDQARREYPDAASRLRVVERVERQKHANKIENAVIGQHIVDLENRRNAGEDVLDELLRTIKASTAAGSEAGRDLVSRKAERYSDYSLAGIIGQHIDTTGKDPTAEQIAKYEELADRIKQLEAEKLKIAEKLAKEIVAREKAEEATKPKPAQEKKGTKSATLQKKADNAIASFKDKWNSLFKGETLFQEEGYDPEESRNKILQEATEVVKVLKEMGVSSFLELQSQLKSSGIDLTAQQTKAFQTAWDAHQKKVKVTSPIGDNPEQAAIGARAKELMRLAIEVGYGATEDTWKDVVNAVYAQLSIEVPGITEYDTMQAMSDYGVWRPLNKEEVAAKIRAVRGKARQSLKIDYTLKAIEKSKEWLEQGVSPEEVAKRLQDMNLLPKATGSEQATPDSIERELIAEFNKLKKDLPVSAESKEGQLKSALTTAKTAGRNKLELLDKDIKALEQAVADRKALVKPVDERTRLKPDEDLLKIRKRLEDKRKQRDDLKTKYEEIFPPTVPKVGRKELTDEQKLAMSERMLKTSIDAVKKEIEALGDGSWSPSDKKAAPTSEIKEALQAELAALNEARNEARKASPVYQALQEKKYWEQYRKSQEKRLAFWEKRRDEAASGILPVPRKKRTITEEAILDKNLEIEKVQYEAMYEIEKAKRANWNAGQWIGYGLLEATSLIPKTLMLGMEMSYVLRQGFFYSRSHPIKAFSALVESIPAVWSQRLALASMESIESRPNAKEYEIADVEFTKKDGPKAKMEEMYQSAVIQWLENTETKWLLPFRAWVKTYGAFERGNRTFANIMKADLYDIQKRDTLAAREYFAELEKKTGGRIRGASTEWTENDMKQTGRIANIFSGRGTGIKGGSPFLDFVFLARRWVWSRIQADFVVPFQLMTPKMLGQWDADRGMRVALAKLYLQTLVGHAAKLSMAYFVYSLLAGDDEEEKPTFEWDPRSSDAWAIKVGETRFKDEGGLMPAFVLASRIATGKIKTASGELKSIYGEDVEWGGKDAKDFIIDFAKYKLGTGLSAFLELVSGRDAVGNPITKTSIATSRITPLTWREIAAAEQELGVAKGTLAALEAYLGVSVSTRGDRTKYRNANEAEQEKQFDKYIKKMKFDSPDPAYKEFLSEKEMSQVNERREDRKQGLVYEAAANPIRKSFKTDKTFEQAVKERDAALENLKKSGFSLEDSRKLLIEHWESSYGSAKEMRGGVRVYKEALSDRLKQLRKVYSQ